MKQREILFKGITIDNNEIIYGSLVTHDNEEFRIVNTSTPPQGYRVTNVKQYVGIKDKNNKRIWEGDKVHVKDEVWCDAIDDVTPVEYTGIVKWLDTGFYIVTRERRYIISNFKPDKDDIYEVSIEVLK